jgi:hypothetical protein
LHLFVLLNTRLLGIRILELFWVLVLLLFDVFSRCYSELLLQLFELLLGLELLALCDIFSVKSPQLRHSRNDVVFVAGPASQRVTSQIELLDLWYLLQVVYRFF